MPRRDDEFTPDPFENEFLEKDPTETDLKHPTEEIDLSDDFYDHQDHQICPVDDPRAAIWQESAFWWEQDYEAPDWQPDQIFEMARFPVPVGKLGVVTVLETAFLSFSAVNVAQVNNADQWPEFYMNAVRSWPSNRGRAVQFYLRLESMTRSDLPRQSRTYPTRNDLPGVPFNQLGTWWDTRYDYLRKQHPRFLVTEGHYLSLWVEMVSRSITKLVGIWGRLAGITQVYKDNPQAINAARDWQEI